MLLRCCNNDSGLYIEEIHGTSERPVRRDLRKEPTMNRWRNDVLKHVT